MNEPVKKYLAKVRRRLCASRTTKERLLSGLAAELAESGNGSYGELVAAFGPPETVADELQSSVPDAELLYQRRKAKILATVLSILCFLLAVLIVCYIWYVMNDTFYLEAEDATVYSRYSKDFMSFIGG